MVEPTTAIVTTSGIVGEAYHGLKAGSLQVCRWMARKQGLTVLKKLPTALQAMVFGDDLSPELLAALSLGGSPGIKLSTLALMHTTDWGVGSFSFEAYLTTLLEDASAPQPPGIQSDTRMNDGLHKVRLLDGQPDRDVLIRSPSQSTSCLDAIGPLTVVGCVSPSEDFTRGIIVYSPGDDRFWYCENRFGTLESSAIDMYPNNDARIDVSVTNNGSLVFSVNPATLALYAEFDRILSLLKSRGYADVVHLLGLAKVAEDLGVAFANTITGGDCDLLSRSFLRRTQGLQGNYGSLQIPTDIESRAREKGQALSLSDRQYERTRFNSIEETITAFLKEVRDRANGRGSVGCQPYDKSTGSLLIKSCILDSLGESRAFAIFQGFRKSKLNIAVSSGSTAIYFPGLNLTVAFPEGPGAFKNTSFRQASPFMRDLSLTLPILVDLAPKIGKDRLTKVAKALSKELAADPSLALSPLTENVLRSFSAMEVRKHLLSDLFSVTTGAERHSEAAMGGVLSQLGVTFTLPPGGSPEMRCYFDRCREAGWGKPRGTVGEVVVDCRVNIEGCEMYSCAQGRFLGTEEPGDKGTEKKASKIAGALAHKKVLEDCLEAETNLLEAITSQRLGFAVPRPVPAKCYVG